ncbi:MAG: heavy metal translocating P-type ATPase [Verrucomicrobia bacterium]|nr:heavy metal translocating P-type ATPase [Verrucomicrobiota bacterium]
MPESSETKPQPPRCLLRAMASTLDQEPALEAVTIDRQDRSISVATLGPGPDPGLAERVAANLPMGAEDPASSQCGLLSGQSDCDACGQPLPAAVRQAVTVTRDAHQFTLARVTCPTARRFWRWRRIRLPRVVQRDVEFFEPEEHPAEWPWQLLATAGCALFGALGAVLTPDGVRPAGVGLMSYLLAYLAGGWFAAQEVWTRLRRATLDVHFLMLAVALGSAAIHEWTEGVTLLFLFSLSGAMEHYAMDRTRREIRSLFKDAPKTATLLDAQNREVDLPVERLQPGMRLLVKPDAQFPVDAEILRGATAADESNLTGESLPVDKNVGDLVLAGTLNLWGAVEAAVLRPVSESALQKIIRLIRDAQRQKAPSQRSIDRFSTAYTYGIIGVTAVMFLVWWLAFPLAPFSAPPGESSAFYRAMTLLVVASPCALVLSIPSAVLAAIAWGARHGVLFRGGAAVEKLAEIDVVALDKTGTLTTGELAVERIESMPPGRESEVARLAYSLERLSNHPLARAITRYGKQHGLAPAEFDHFESVTGQGVRAWRDQQAWFLGRRDAPDHQRHAAPLARVPPAAAGFSEVWLSGPELLGRILLRDDLRPEARPLIEEMRRAGLRTVVLTGDRKAAGEHLKSTLGLDDVRAELTPEEKVAAIRSLSSAGRRVAMVGDGVNDAPSLAAAHVGVAMGARGSDAALEQAEVVLMHDRLENFLAAYNLSQRARAVIRQNQVVSLGTVVVLVAFALAGHIPLTLGVVGHEGSTVAVVMNSLRLLFGRHRRPHAD